MDEPFETEAQPRRQYMEDWERETAGRRLYPNAYWGPVMDLFNAGAHPVREAILGHMTKLGVPQGLNKNATPEQRKALMLWAEKKWPRLCASIPSWPKDEQGNASLASKFHQSQQEAAAAAAAPGDVPLSGGWVMKPPKAGRIVMSGRSGGSPAAAGHAGGGYVAGYDTGRTGPSVSIAVTCFCGKGHSLRPATGQYKCTCGATVTVSELLIQMQPSSGPVTFGADPEGDGPQPLEAYSGTTVRDAKRVVAQAAALRPGVVPLGKWVNEDEDVGLPPNFTGLGGMRVGPIGNHRREPYSSDEAGDPGDTQDLGEVPEDQGGEA